MLWPHVKPLWLCSPIVTDRLKLSPLRTNSVSYQRDMRDWLNLQLYYNHSTLVRSGVCAQLVKFLPRPVGTQIKTIKLIACIFSLGCFLHLSCIFSVQVWSAFVSFPVMVALGFQAPVCCFGETVLHSSSPTEKQASWLLVWAYISFSAENGGHVWTGNPKTCRREFTPQEVVKLLLGKQAEPAGG